MKRNEIMEMAREAGFEVITPHEWVGYTNSLEAFANLVAMRTLEGTYDEMIDIVRKNEREVCAKLCYELPWKDMTQIPSNLAFAAAIRARGEA
jgi:hypothetical protein